MLLIVWSDLWSLQRSSYLWYHSLTLSLVHGTIALLSAIILLIHFVLCVVAKWHRDSSILVSLACCRSTLRRVHALLIALISIHKLTASCIRLHNCVLQTRFWIIFEISNYLPIIVHPMYSYCLWIKSHTSFDDLTIILVKIIKSVTKTYTTLILHQCIKPSWLCSLPTLLTWVQHFSSTIRIIDSSLNLLRMSCDWLILIISNGWYLFVLTIWGSVICLVHRLWYSTFVI